MMDVMIHNTLYYETERCMQMIKTTQQNKIDHINRYENIQSLHGD